MPLAPGAIYFCLAGVDLHKYRDKYRIFSLVLVQYWYNLQRKVFCNKSLGWGLYYKTFYGRNLRLKRLARDKNSSLLRKSVNYDRKKFYSTGPWSTSLSAVFDFVYFLEKKIWEFSNPGSLNQNKLERGLKMFSFKSNVDILTF
jgi:hypothetical protein